MLAGCKAVLVPAKTRTQQSSRAVHIITGMLHTWPRIRVAHSCSLNARGRLEGSGLDEDAVPPLVKQLKDLSVISQRVEVAARISEQRESETRERAIQDAKEEAAKAASLQLFGFLTGEPSPGPVLAGGARMVCRRYKANLTAVRGPQGAFEGSSICA